MIMAFIHTIGVHLASLIVHLAPLADDLPDPNGLFTAITEYVLKIVAGIGAVYFVWDMMGHIDSANRNVRKLVTDSIITVLLLIFVAKGTAIIAWAKSKMTADMSPATPIALVVDPSHTQINNASRQIAWHPRVPEAGDHV